MLRPTPSADSASASVNRCRIASIASSSFSRRSASGATPSRRLLIPYTRLSIDMTVVFGEQIFLFEFKVVASRSTEGKAIAQLRERNYAAKYRGRGWPIHLIGVEFSKETRALVGFEAAPADQPAPTKP